MPRRTMMPLARPGFPRVGVHRRGAAAATLLLVGLLAVAPPATRAAGPPAGVPNEVGATTLTEPVYAALTADVNGDGTRDLIAVVPTRDDPTHRSVAIWHQEASSSWVMSGETPLRRDASPGEQTAGSDAVRLLAWHVGSRVRVLAVTTASVPYDGNPPCCLTVWEVTEQGTGPPRVVDMADEKQGALEVLSADLDGDGVDELILQESPGASGSFTVPITVLHWNGTGFIRLSAEVATDDPAAIAMWILGDSDGRPGVEVALEGTGTCAQGAGWVLTRLGEQDGRLVTSSICMLHAGRALAVPDGLGPGKPAVLYGDLDVGVSTISWPAGRAAQVVSTAVRRGRPLAVLGSAGNQWIVLERTASDRPVIELDRPDLTLVASTTVAQSIPASFFVDSPFRPYVGPFPASGAGPAGFVFDGTLVQPQAEGAPRARGIAALAAAAPLGSVGRGGQDMALLRLFTPTPGPTGADVDPRGGTLLPGALHIVSLVPLAAVMVPEANSGAVAPVIIGAIADPAATSSGRLLAGSRGFAASISTPPGSICLAVADHPGAPNILGVSGLLAPAQTVRGGPPFHVPIDGPASAMASGQYQVELYLVTPEAHAYHAFLSVRVLRGPPSVSASGSFFSPGLSATVRGSTEPTSQVTVDGTSVQVALDGTFAASVPAGLVPREVRVVVTDPFGHLASATISVVAPLDYRRLPWVPIVAVLTLAAAAFLFLRAPSSRRRTIPATVEEGVVEEGIVEEIELD